MASPVVARILGAAGSPLDLGGAQLIAGIPAPGIITRAQWGADESLRSGTPEFAPLRKLVLHHTATGVAGDPAETVRAIYKHHVVTNGWNDIGYHFLIAPDGRIYEGRFARAYAPGEAPTGEDTAGNVVQGAHVDQFNKGTLGVALIGNFTSAAPAGPALESLVQVLAWACDRHGLDPFDISAYTNSAGVVQNLPTILGHRDVDSTGCPGDAFHPMIQDIRARVAATIADGFIGYRFVDVNGSMAHFGGARDYGDLNAVGVRTRIVGGAAVPDAQGYWLADPTGAVYSFGVAQFFGSLPALRNAGFRIGSAAILGIAATTTGRGYWLYDSVGGIFSFGDAQFFGSLPALRNAGIPIGPSSVVAMVATPSGNGYWVLDSVGGIFSFGDAQFFGSVPALRNAGFRIGPARTVGMAPTPSGLGYWVLDENGGVFAFGDAQFFGSVPGLGIIDPPARRIVASPSGGGYLIATRSGAIYAFGDAPFHGRWIVPDLNAVDLIPVIRRR